MTSKHSEEKLKLSTSNRMHRRAFLQSGIGTAAIATLLKGRGLAFAAESANSPAVAIVDSRFAHAIAYAQLAASHDMETLFFAGDLTKLWSDDLDLRWRASPVVTCGMTTAGALDCLRFLAAGYRMHVREQVTVATQSLQDPLVSWVLAPAKNSTESF